MKKNNQIKGISDFRIVPVIGDIFNNSERTTLVITSSYNKAKEIALNLSYFVRAKIHILPEEEPFLLQYEAKSRGDLDERLEAIYSISSEEPSIIIAPVTGAVKKMPPREELLDNYLLFEKNKDISIDEIKSRLVNMGFDRQPFTEEKGHFSIRGEIVDVFPVNSEYPIRVDIFDTEIETIKLFDPITQKSVNKIDRFTVYPATSVVLNEEHKRKAIKRIDQVYEDGKIGLKPVQISELNNRKSQIIESIETGTNYRILENYISYLFDETSLISDYLPDNSLVFIDDSDRLREMLALREREVSDDFSILVEKGAAVSQDLDNFPGTKEYDSLFDSNINFFFTPFTNKPNVPLKITGELEYVVKAPPHFNGHMDVFKKQLLKYLDQGYKVTIVCSTTERKNNVEAFLKDDEISGDIEIKEGTLSTGFVLESQETVILRDGDIFKTSKKKVRKPKDENAKPIRSFADINNGDFVVHESHGIGKYLGVEQLETNGNKKDYLKIKYAGADLLYVPVEQMNIIQKFIGGGDKTPKVSKLSGGEWKKAKAKAKKDIAEMSKELLQLSAQRKTIGGYAFSPDTVWQKDFEEQFPYKETDDQLRSAESIKRDMEKPYPMDRLLCGDVGYGKTEVAARAVFKCVAEGKQAAVLVPTTILANQHFISFTKRFKEFPFKVEMLSRFRSPKEQAKIIDDLKKGKIDIIISTHRMFSKDVQYKDLGLLVVDEEQRFGVKHKEMLKELKRNVDVLTLSATPIPRTLHMSLIGIRDMDVIEEPPEDRYPVQTYVMEENDDIIRETIRRELDRDGQVYVVFNRVKGIQGVAEKLKTLVPESKVSVGHGQMSEVELENVMLDFIDKKFNVLIATSIIESGIDIQNVNTIIILDADKFGLSQLYQLRGRVGRTNRVAYAYLLHKRNKILSEVAEKRLLAIKEFTEFGAGFKISMRDLEIRGAGNLLGTQQSGHMMAIGYELYCKMVDDAVRSLSGEVVKPDKEDVVIDLPVSAYIPDSYIDDEEVKLEIYKEIASVVEREQYDVIKTDLTDRFGNMPRSVINLMKVSLLKSYSEKAGFDKIRTLNKDIIMEFDNRGPKEETVENVISIYGKRLSRKGKMSPYVLFRDGRMETLDVLLELVGRFVI